MKSHRLIILLGILFASCSQNPRERIPDLNTTRWAAAQDRMFARDTVPNLDSVEQFATLHAISRGITPSNLTLRQNVLRAASMPGTEVSRLAMRRVQMDFAAIQADTFWREGVSYFDYVRGPLLWYVRVTGDTIIHPDMLERIWANYRAIAAPDGDVPLPEAHAGLGLVPDIAHAPGQMFQRRAVGPYIAMRWFAGDTVRTYLLMRTGDDPELPLNLHKRRETGYFALWHDGQWVVRCAPYTGFQRDVALKETGFIEQLPPSSVRAPTWRIDPPTIHAGKDSTSYWFTWKNGRFSPKSSRRVSVTDTAIIVVDRWGWFGKSVRVFNLKK